MNTVFRQSPVTFSCKAAEKTYDDNWEVVLAFADEGKGPWLVDLSHLQRWDFQHVEMGSTQPLGLSVPAKPGQVNVHNDKVIARMNRTQAMISCLARGDTSEVREALEFTEMTDAHCALAVVGEDVPCVMEHVSNLDLFDPDRPMPFLTQGPVMHIPCQVLTLGIDCVLLTFSRGYGQSFADAMLHAASGQKLRPGGENIFSQWLLKNSGKSVAEMPVESSEP